MFSQFEPLWSYKEWIVGDFELGKEILANIAMFIPLVNKLLIERCIEIAEWRCDFGR